MIGGAPPIRPDIMAITSAAGKNNHASYEVLDLPFLINPLRPQKISKTETINSSIVPRQYDPKAAIKI